MRTTITLEPDVELLLRSAMRERSLSFKEAVNSAVRAGLTTHRPERKPFVQKTYSLGKPNPNFNFDKALSLAFAMDDEEMIRRMNLPVKDNPAK